MLKESLRLHWKRGDRWRTASLLEALGGVIRDPRLLGATATLRHELGTPVPPAEGAQVQIDVADIGVEECAIDAPIAARWGKADPRPLRP